MKLPRACLTLATALALVCGCESPKFLVQPGQVPEYLDSYAAPLLGGRTKDVLCKLNLANCVETAVVSVRTVSGKYEPDQTFPIRALVDSEFRRVVAYNFTPVKDGAQPHVELAVETQKAILTRDGKKLKFDYAASIKLLNPVHEDKPYFGKIYSATARGTRVDDTTVPFCVYEAIQQTVSDFLKDLSADSTAVSQLDAMTP